MIHCWPVAERSRSARIFGRATFTIETSSTTMNWATQHTISTAQLGMTRFDISVLLAISGRGRAASCADAPAGGIGIGVVEHVAGPLAGAHGQLERGVGSGIAHGDPGPAAGGGPPQADLDAGTAPAMQLDRIGGWVV